MLEEIMKGAGVDPSAADSGAAASENPFMKACQQMFKEFDAAKATDSGPEGGAEKEDPQLMNFLNMFTKELMNPDGT